MGKKKSEANGSIDLWDEQPGGEGAAMGDFGSLDESGLRNEITMMRVAMRRLFKRGEVCENSNEMATLVNNAGMAVFRLARLLKTQESLPNGEMTLQEAFDQALKETWDELGITEVWGEILRFP